MTTRESIINHCLTLPAVYEDYPFADWGKGEVKDSNIWTVMRHRTNKKMFATIYERQGKLCVNLKCDPLEADFLRQMFTSVTPGYHMNKTHWNTVIIGGDVPDGELRRMIAHSYDLTKPKVRKRQQS